MKISDIINRVRRCIDEESSHDGYIGVTTDDETMNILIKSHIGDSLRWCAMYATHVLTNVTAKDSGQGAIVFDSSAGMLKDYSLKMNNTNDFSTPEVRLHDGSMVQNPPVFKSRILSFIDDEKYCELMLPHETIKVLRIKHDGWYKAVTSFITDDSDNYLELRDRTVAATLERPVAALVEGNPLRMELYPVITDSNGNIHAEITLITDIDTGADYSLYSDNDNIDVPVKIASAFVYHLSFLVLAAYNDVNKANQMLGIAKMYLGISNTTN